MEQQTQLSPASQCGGPGLVKGREEAAELRPPLCSELCLCPGRCPQPLPPPLSVCPAHAPEDIAHRLRLTAQHPLRLCASPAASAGGWTATPLRLGRLTPCAARLTAVAALHCCRLRSTRRRIARLAGRPSGWRR